MLSDYVIDDGPPLAPRHAHEGTIDFTHTRAHEGTLDGSKVYIRHVETYPEADPQKASEVRTQRHVFLFSVSDESHRPSTR